VGSCTSKIIMLTIFLNNRITELLFANLSEQHKVESKVVLKTILTGPPPACIWNFKSVDEMLPCGTVYVVQGGSKALAKESHK